MSYPERGKHARESVVEQWTRRFAGWVAMSRNYRAALAVIVAVSLVLGFVVGVIAV